MFKEIDNEINKAYVSLFPNNICLLFIVQGDE